MYSCSCTRAVVERVDEIKNIGRGGRGVMKKCREEMLTEPFCAVAALRLLKFEINNIWIVLLFCF